MSHINAFLAAFGILVSAIVALRLVEIGPDFTKPIFWGLPDQVAIMRFAGDSCQDGTSMDPERFTIINAGDCHNWESAKFNSFVAGWRDYNTFGEDWRDYGDCEIRVWEEPGCKGRSTGVLRHANEALKNENGRFTGFKCLGHLADEDLVPGNATSMKVSCRK